MANYLITWLITIGSGGSSRLVSRWGISQNFRRGQSKIWGEYIYQVCYLSGKMLTPKWRVYFIWQKYVSACWKYLSQLMYSFSWESCSLLVLTYCHNAWMMQERVWVWMPRRRARRGSNLNWGGWNAQWIKEMK